MEKELQSARERVLSHFGGADRVLLERILVDKMTEDEVAHEYCVPIDRVIELKKAAIAYTVQELAADSRHKRMQDAHEAMTNEKRFAAVRHIVMCVVERMGLILEVLDDPMSTGADMFAATARAFTHGTVMEDIVGTLTTEYLVHDLHLDEADDFQAAKLLIDIITQAALDNFNVKFDEVDTRQTQELAAILGLEYTDLQ